MTKYQTIDCQAGNEYLDHLINTGVKCINPDKLDKDPFHANGVRYTFLEHPQDSLTLSTRLRNFDNSGKRIFFLLFKVKAFE